MPSGGEIDDGQSSEREAYISADKLASVIRTAVSQQITQFGQSAVRWLAAPQFDDTCKPAHLFNPSLITSNCRRT